MQPTLGAEVHYNSEVGGHLNATIKGLNMDGTVDLTVDAYPNQLFFGIERNDEAEELETWHFPEDCKKAKR